MMKKPFNEKAAGWGAKAAFKNSSYVANYYKNLATCQFELKQTLPSPTYYYTDIFGSLPSNRDWVSVSCDSHIDNRPSLRLNLDSGGYFCHSCGKKGGDIIAFYRHKHEVSFKTAVAELKLIALEEESSCQ